jgi:hypothetical protein
MKKYVEPGEAQVAAFVFTEREQDYGGIHLGVPDSSTEGLVGLTDEFAVSPLGHSRRLSLLPVPKDLPEQITPRRYKALVSLRVGTTANSVTRIQVNDGVGTITLSLNGVAEFKRAIKLVHETKGDLLMAGESGLPTDRLWFWPLER